MSFYDKLIANLPEVASPTQKKLGFKEKLKWTMMALVSFFIMGIIPLFGLDPQNQFRFEQLEMLLGASFGSIISLGIGPIVTASIVLQLLNGSGIIKFDLNSQEGKKRFQGTQKLLIFGFIIFEAIIYVFMGGLAPSTSLPAAQFAQMQWFLVFQLILGGVVILFMDEVVQKWGFGSGVSLFIAAGVSKTIFIRAFSWLRPEDNPEVFVGAIPEMFRALSEGLTGTFALAFSGIVATFAVFALSVYSQSMKVEIPLSFGKVRGYGIRWPLNFFYTSNIPVILIAALLANIQLWARLLANWGYPLLGTFGSNGNPMSGFVLWIQPTNIVGKILNNNLVMADVAHSLVYVLVMIVGAVIFSIFWAQTAGMDARSQAKNIMSSGLQIPGFRKDQRILERVLNRYIQPLTVMGGIAVGFLAAIADLTGALASGTGILLAVMIIYKLYEEIAKDHMMDMNPMMRKFME